MTNRDVTFQKKRTRCPSCGSSDGFAGVMAIDGAPCGDPQRHGKCFSCDVMIWPDDAPSSEARPNQQTERKPSAVVRAGLIAETSAQTSNLHSVLINIGGEGMAAHLRQWNIGTDGEGRTLFHYINSRGQHQTTKGIAYDAAGSRISEGPQAGARFGVRMPSGYVPLTSKEGHTSCLFGEQWTQAGQSMIDYRNPAQPRKWAYDDRTPVVLVESEKTAVVASYMMPNLIWIATGGTNGITKDKATALRDRVVLIMFDCDRAGREAATKAAQIIGNAGGKPIHEIDGKPVQDHVFRGAADGFDIADHVMETLSIMAADNQKRSMLRISEGAA